MSIKWNKYTWYSKLLAVIFFIGVLPAWTFYLGMQYEATERSLAAPIVVFKPLEEKANWKVNTFKEYDFGIKAPESWNVDVVPGNKVASIQLSSPENGSAVIIDVSTTTAASVSEIEKKNAQNKDPNEAIPLFKMHNGKLYTIYTVPSSQSPKSEADLQIILSSLIFL